MSEGPMTPQDRLASRARRRAVAAIGFALAFVAPFSPLAAQAPAGESSVTGPEVVGVPWTGSWGITESVPVLNTRGAPELAAPRPLVLKEEFEGLEGSLRKMNPLSPAAASWPPQGASVALPGPPRTPQSLGTTFTAATLADSGFVPPDTMGAIGPSQFLAIENGIIRTFGRNGVADGALNTSTNAFFASVRTATFSTSDPRVRFDWTSQRWIIVMIDVATPNRVLLAVSSGATIASLSSFTFFQFRQDQPTPAGSTSCLADYPSIGVDVNAVYIGVNQFCPGFTGSDVFVVRKSSIVGAGPIVVTPFRGVGTIAGGGLWAPHGVDNDDLAATAGYFIGSDILSYGVLDIRRVSDPGGTPTLSGTISLTIPQTLNPIAQEHLGNNHPGGTYNGKLDGCDDRVIQSRIANDSTLWTSHGISVNSSGVASAGDRNALRWYQIGSLATTPVLVQSGTIFDPSASNPLGYTYGSVAVNRQGHAAFAMTAVGPASYSDAAQTGRLASDSPGFANTPIKYTAASVAYNPTFDTGTSRPRRWGDFSAISLDPTDEMTLWAVGEYTDNATSGGSWGVKVAQLLAPPPATPVSANPPTVTAGSTATVAITGTSVSGSGFYDTTSGFSFSKHIAAGVSGTGVTVDTVTYTSPISISVSLTVTAGATLGARDVTVTNPDGQSASGSGILTITSGCTPPATPVVTTPAAAGEGSPNRAASVASHAGSTYVWAIGNGTITSGQGTRQISFTAGTAGTPLTLSVTETNSSGCPSAAGNTTVTVLSADSALQYYTVLPCRVADTRVGSGFPAGYGQPSIAGGGARNFAITGQCGIPAGARAVSFNFVVWNTTSYGDFKIYPAGGTVAPVSTLNWGPRILMLANAAIMPLGTSGQITIVNEGSGTVNLIFDVNGYFQ